MHSEATLSRRIIVTLMLALTCVRTPAAPAHDAPPIGCFNSHCDTELDIFHADITAALVGCKPQKNDLVLVNGKRQDGILWTLFRIEPANIKPIESRSSAIMKRMGQTVPTTLPAVSFRLKSGYYSGLTLTVGKCSFGPFPLATTDASGDRHLLLVEGRSTMPTDVAGVYGYMPLPGLQVVLRGATREDCLVAKDEIVSDVFGGNTYMFYFDAVKPGRYTLTVSGTGWEKTLGEVSVVKPGELVLRYIHASEIDL